MSKASVNETEKGCSRCKAIKPLADFYRDNSAATGRASICKVCQNKYYREVQYPLRKLSDSYKLCHRKRQQKWAKENEVKTRAHRLVRQANITGKECENCGATDKLHAHHPDYSKPLEIVTLCVPCHELVHHGVKA